MASSDWVNLSTAILPADKYRIREVALQQGVSTSAWVRHWLLLALADPELPAEALAAVPGDRRRRDTKLYLIPGSHRRLCIICNYPDVLPHPDDPNRFDCHNPNCHRSFTVNAD